MTVTSILQISIKPDKLDEAPSVVSHALEATRAFEGNLGVDVVIDAADPAHWALVERWESLEADDAYRAFRQSEAGRSELGVLLAAAPVLTRYTATEF